MLLLRVLSLQGKMLEFYNKKSLEDSIQRVKRGLVQDNLNATEAGESSTEKQKMLSTVELLEKEAKENKPIGRISLNLYYDLERFKNSSYDIVLKDKDTLYIPSVNDTVSVVGEVLNQNTFVYQSDLDVDNYIAKAGGLNMNADDDFIYVIKANGEAFKFEKNFYFGGSQEVFKGDTIVVPLKIDIVSDIEFAKDVTQIVYQLAVTAASLNSIGSL